MKALVAMVRIGFGALFIWAGAAKLADPWALADAVHRLGLLPAPAIMPFSLWLPWWEILIGAAAIAGRPARTGLAGMAFLSACFLGVMGGAWLRGIDVTCGCFGKQAAGTVATAVVRNAIMLAGTTLLYLEAWRNHRARP